jgi:hypothetical protein
LSSTCCACDGKHYARGLCKRHYQKARRLGAEGCAQPGCSRPRLARGFCASCYQRERREGRWKRKPAAAKVRISVRVEPGDWLAAKRWAWAEGVAAEELIRRALKALLEQRAKRPTRAIGSVAA